MKRYISLLFLVFVWFNTIGQEIQVGVYRSHTILTIEFSVLKGKYLIYGDTSIVGVLSKKEKISISKVTNNVSVNKEGKWLGTFNKLTLIPLGIDFALRLQPQKPLLNERIYEDGFIVFSGKIGLAIVNDVMFKHYLGGVIESEGGGGKAIEYYKAQAVISRTYALKHFTRHKDEGFNLCDQVHCQAYYNRLTYTNDIRKAIESTDGIYLVDTLSHDYVEAYFHANCGGQTIGSDYVWNEGVSYLQSIKDTFCTRSSHSNWEKKIPQSEWIDFLVKQYFYPIQDSLYKRAIFTFEQENRKAFYLSPHLGIPLRDIRYRFKLKSTFFSCFPEDQFVVIKGKGFGHGVGLCQEGAMSMAEKGYSYQQILRYYFQGIEFESYFNKLFFRQVPNYELKF